MKVNFERFKKIVNETENIIKEFQGIKRLEAFKRAVVKIKLSEEQEYTNNGEIVNDLIGTQNIDPSY